MSKELFISSSPHETKVAVLDDDQVVEVYYERDTDVGLVGSIYKGRVSRVLPGMQSAFVNVGLERDAFLYVSDFFEDAEEYDKVVAEAEARVTRYTEVPAAAPPSTTSSGEATSGGAGPATAPEVAAQLPAVYDAPAVAAVPLAAAAPPPPPTTESHASPSPVPPAPHPPERPASERPEFRRHEHRGRRRRRGRGFGDHKFTPRPEFRERAPERAEGPDYGAPHAFEVLPGESLAKYSHLTAPTPPQAGTEASTSQPTPPEVTPVVTARVEEEDPRAEFGAVPAAGHALLIPPAPLSETAPVEEIPAPISAPARNETEPETKPQPLWQRLVSTVFREGAHPSESAGGSPSESREGAGSQSASTDYSAETAEATQAVRQPEDDLSAGGPLAMETGTSEQQPSTPGEAHTSVAAATPGSSAGPAEREYTLREPHQRPRFASRRGRRGRRGRGPSDSKPESAPSTRHEPSRPGNNQSVQIAELLKEGQEILVQIAKEPLGRKGARITSHIALPGRYLVYMPTVDHIGVSRKIASEEERLRLRNIILENKGSLTGGIIVRTAGEGRSEEELKADLKYLSTLWGDVRGKAERMKAPALLHRDLDLVQRLLRDLLSPDFKTVRVDSESEYERTLDFVSRCQPSLVGHVKLYTRDTPMFEEFGIQAEIDKALKSKVWLKSGGYIVINQTEALVAIDVNTGKYVGKTNRLEDTIVKTNIDAVREIVRQIRVRDLGGIVVIDFIDMDERRNRNKVVQALEEALRSDRAPTKILSFNDFGLVAITRKRVKQSLERTLCEPCTNCSGSGWIKSVTTVCYEILAEARKMARQLEGDVVTLRVNPEVAHALKSREGLVLSELESITHKDVIIKSDPTVHQERFEIY